MNEHQEISEYMVQAQNELKRAHHLIYVSLKYSRTVDVIQSALLRLADAFESGIAAALDQSLSEEQKETIIGIRKKCEAFLLLFPDLKEEVEFFLRLRLVCKAPIVQKLNEYRRHVTLVCLVDGEEIPVKIETAEEYYHRTKHFINNLSTELYGEISEEHTVRPDHWIVRNATMAKGQKGRAK